MAILHRIFVSKHKHKKTYIGRKTTYKKFLGLKTFKNVVYTKLSLPYLPDALKEVVKKKIVIKKPKVKFRKHVKFRMLKSFMPNVRCREIILAQADIENFRNIKAETPEEKTLEEKFQAFLPHAIWAKMTYEQRGVHIRKRKVLAIQNKFRSLKPSKYAFSNKQLRPVLTGMHFASRRKYLRSLVKFASADFYNTTVPLGDPGMAELDSRNIKLNMRAGGKLSTKAAYKNLTYNSLLPKRTTALIFKN